MTTSEMGFPVTQEREEVQCWQDIVDHRPVARFLSPVITTYIRGFQDTGTSGETDNCRGRKYCLTGVSFTPHSDDLDMSEHNEGKKLRQGHWEQTSISRWKDSPDPLPDPDVVVHPGRVDKFETVIPG